MKFQRYKRGSIVMIDFSPSVGSETSGKHFGIVLTKNDSPNNAVLTVVPITSKSKPYYLPLGNFLMSQAFPYLKQFILNIKEQNESCTEDSDFLKILDNLNDFDKLLTHYEAKNVNSYAMVCNITTISKKRIKKPINQYDPISKIRLPEDLLNLIDQEIIKQFTK